MTPRYLNETDKARREIEQAESKGYTVAIPLHVLVGPDGEWKRPTVDARGDLLTRIIIAKLSTFNALTTYKSWRESQ